MFRLALQEANAAKAEHGNCCSSGEPEEDDPKEPVIDRFTRFVNVYWISLSISSSQTQQKRSPRVVHVARKTIQSNEGQSEHKFCHGRDIFRAALEGAPIAPGNQVTLNSLRDESRRPRTLREPLPDHLFGPSTRGNIRVGS